MSKATAAAKNVSQTAENKKAPRSFTFTPADFANGALFPVAPEDRTETGPLMSGSIDLNGQKLPVSAFLKTAKESKNQYLSLSVGDEGGVHYYGKLFRKEPPANVDPQSAQVRYSGFLTILPCINAQQHDDEAWEAAPKLVIGGERRRNASNGGARIALIFSPEQVADSEIGF